MMAILGSLGLGSGDLVGHGGEAWVFALGADRVVRILNRAPDPGALAARHALVDELRPGAAAAGFVLNEVLEVRSLDGRVFEIERRLPGLPLARRLREIGEGRARDRLIEAHLEAAAALGDLPLAPRPFFGDLLGLDPVRSPSWPGFLLAKASRAIARGGLAARVDAGALVADLPPVERAGFVHLDGFVGNMMCEGSRITAVLDIGHSAVRGDVRLDPVASAVYLAAPEIARVATPRDNAVAWAWLRSAGLDGLYEPYRRWLAAFWSFATDDPPLAAWCRRTLGVGS
jgi:hypothetical protein